jgi:hypothetical protein
MKQRYVLFLVFLLSLTALAPADPPREKKDDKPAPRALEEASAGFNDAEGLNADRIPDSPYPLGKRNRQGGKGEPGWATLWPATEKAIFQKEVVFEGDGALYLVGTTGYARRLKKAQDSALQVEQHVQIPADGDLTVYLRKTAGDAGPMWKVSEGKFRVLEGDERGDGKWIDTDIACIPGRWYKVTQRVDVAKREWEFFVNGNKFPGGPWHFRFKVEYLIDIDYLTETQPGAYIDALKIGPVPDPSKP